MTGQMSSSLCSQVPVPRKLFGNYSSLLIKFRLQRYVRICIWQKLIGKYILLDISKISKLQNVLLQFSESVKIVAGQSVLLGLLRAQHAARVNELGLILA